MFQYLKISVVTITLSLILFFSMKLIMQPLENEVNKNIVTIGFMGDVMLGRLVNETIKTEGYEYPWGNLLNVVKENNINIINLETTFTTSEKKIPKVFNFKSDPQNAEVLKKANITVANMANNHSLDFSSEGFFDTIQALDNADILHVGAGKNQEEAKKAVIIQQNDLKIGIIGYTDNEPTWLATKEKAGTNYVKVGDIEKIKKDIQEVRNKVDILIATIHWGPNMRSKPSPDFINFAHQMIDVGIDIIHGHSAHVTQGIEIYKNKIIMYDTGDFVDDYAVDSDLRNDLSFLFKIAIENKKIKEVNLIPVKIGNMQVNIAVGNDKKLIVDRMIKFSKELGTYFNENVNGLSLKLQKLNYFLH